MRMAACPPISQSSNPATQNVVDNDVNLMALGEHRIHYREVRHLLFAKVGTGIGCGIVINGEWHRGAQGSAGDIGHTIILGGSLARFDKVAGTVGVVALAQGHILSPVGVATPLRTASQIPRSCSSAP